MSPRRRRNVWDLAVVGGGIAGLTAAWQSARRGCATVLLEPGAAYGGQVANVNHLRDWPATAETSGYGLASALAAELRNEAVELCNEAVERIVPEGDLVRLEGVSRVVRARRALVASGASLRRLDVPGEEKLVGRGVSQCADCDGHFFRDGDVVVVGAGDAALHEALVLAGICRSVTVVVRSTVRARPAYVERAASAANLRFVWDSTVDAVLGQDAVRGVALRNVKTGALTELACAGVFAFIGTVPDTGFLPESVGRDETGRVTTDERMRSTLPSVYAIGACRAGYGGDLVAAVGEAATAVKAIASELAL
jgi:thioredoxin reductase (NADPH)